MKQNTVNKQMSIRKLRNQPLRGKSVLLLFISAVFLRFVKGWQDDNFKIVFNGKPERTLCFESFPSFVIAKACLNNHQRKQHSGRYCHTYDTVQLTQVGDNFGFGVYIPPYDGKVCANQAPAQFPINHVLLARKNQFIVCSLSDYTFNRNNCSGQVEFQFIDSVTKNSLSQETIFDMTVPKSERLFHIVPRTHSSSDLHRVLVVSKSGKTSIKRLHHYEDLTHDNLRKHSMFYLEKVLD